MSFQYNDLIHLFNYSIKLQSNKSFWFIQFNINEVLQELKKKYYYNVFIIDCAKYYNDIDVVSLINDIINKQQSYHILNTFNNIPNKNTQDKTIDKSILTKKILFLKNTHTFEESSKNIIRFINTLPPFSANSNFHIFFLFKSISINKNDFLVNKTGNYYTITFKNYNSFVKNKNETFPFCKMKITKRRTEEYLHNILFITLSNEDCQDTYIQDYKGIITNFLTNDTFNYSSIFNVSHYENIPLILYENWSLITNKYINNSLTDDIENNIRNLCIQYYSYNTNPDFYLFKKCNLYYFLYNLKKIIKKHNIHFSMNELNNIKFTKYYSNRASEIQFQKTINTGPF
jgi:hypothetical protein